jgi:hypothetical protein
MDVPPCSRSTTGQHAYSIRRGPNGQWISNRTFDHNTVIKNDSFLSHRHQPLPVSSQPKRDVSEHKTNNRCGTKPLRPSLQMRFHEMVDRFDSQRYPI